MLHARWFLVLAGILMLAGCNLPGAAGGNPTQAPAAGITDPPTGTAMRWVDGSQVILVEMEPIEGQIWITDGAVTWQMYLSCVYAGACEAAPDDAFDSELSEPVRVIEDGRLTDSEYLPFGIVEAYCTWAGGRLATNEEVIAHLNNRTIGKPKYEDFAIESLVFCVIDSPHAVAPMCETSAVYKKDQENPASPIGKITRAADFCQGSDPYVTGGLEIEGCEIASLSSIEVHGEGKCEVIESDKLLCSGAAGTSVEGAALVSCDSAIAANAPSDELDCPAGYTLDPENPALCSYSFGERVNGCHLGMQLVALGGQAFACAPAVDDSGSADSESASSAERRCMFPMCGGVSAAPDVIDSSVCLPGMYFDPALQGCVSAGPATDACLTGFEFDAARGCCQSALPGGLHPGCPAGEAFDPATGACDSEHIFTPEGMLTAVKFSLDLPTCTGGGGAGGCQLSSAACAADGGQDFDAANCKCIPVQ